MAPKKKLTAESDIESVLAEGGWKPVPGAEKKALEEAIRRSAQIRRHGGVRPGAGRKPSGKKSPRKGVYLNILPETVKALELEAGGRRGMGAVVDRLAAALKR